MNLRLFCWGPQYSYGCEFAVLAETEEEAQEAIRAYAVREDAKYGPPHSWMQRAADEALTNPDGCTVLGRGEVYVTEIS